MDMVNIRNELLTPRDRFLGFQSWSLNFATAASFHFSETTGAKALVQSI